MKGYKKGGFKISPSGRIIKFPHLPKRIKEEVHKLR
jgi:hypothetical protein